MIESEKFSIEKSEVSALNSDSTVTALLDVMSRFCHYLQP